MTERFTTTLGECCEIVSGATPQTSVAEYWGGDICWATPKDLSDLEGHFIESTPRKITVAGLRNCAAAVLPANSVLFSSRAPIGHVAVNTTPMATNQGFKSFIPKPDRLEPKFLFHWLRANRVYLESLGNGATFKEVSKAVVSRVPIDLPPVPEQRRIAAILDQADALRAKRREALKQLDSLTQSIFIEMFGALEIPEQTIGELLAQRVLQLHKDGNHGSQYPRSEDFGNVGVPFLSARCISEDGTIQYEVIDRLSEDKADQLRIGWIEGGDVLLAHNASVGKVALYDGRFPRALVGTSLTAFRANRERLIPHFLAAALRSKRFQVQLQMNMGQTTRNQVPISAQRNLWFTLPPLHLQQTFATRIQAVESLKSTHRAALVELDALFASLQHRAFAGSL